MSRRARLEKDAAADRMARVRPVGRAEWTSAFSPTPIQLRCHTWCALCSKHERGFGSDRTDGMSLGPMRASGSCTASVMPTITTMRVFVGQISMRCSQAASLPSTAEAGMFFFERSYASHVRRNKADPNARCWNLFMPNASSHRFFFGRTAFDCRNTHMKATHAKVEDMIALDEDKAVTKSGSRLRVAWWGLSTSLRFLFLAES